MKKLEYFGRVDDKGILKLFNRDGFSDDLQAFIEQDVKITVEIKTSVHSCKMGSTGQTTSVHR